MKNILLFGVVFIILFILYNSNYVELFDSKTILTCSEIDDHCYRVQRKYDPRTYEQAADLLASLNIKNIIFIEYLRNKYLENSIQDNSMETMDNLKKKEMTKNLLRRYNPKSLKEHSPRGIENTSYVFMKGREIGYCLREKKTGKNLLHPIDIMLFVNLHEITHLASSKYDQGHSERFWRNFKLILQEAVLSGIYIPINYNSTPINYCGLDIEYNPLYDYTL